MSREKQRVHKIVDELQGRVRLYRDEFEDFISLYASMKMIASCLDKM